MGRRTMLHNDIFRETLIKNIKISGNLKASAESVGIAESTLHRWLTRGEQLYLQLIERVNNNEITPEEAVGEEKKDIYCAFYQEYTRARAGTFIELADGVIKDAKESGSIRDRLEVLTTLYPDYLDEAYRRIARDLDDISRRLEKAENPDAEEADKDRANQEDA